MAPTSGWNGRLRVEAIPERGLSVRHPGRKRIDEQFPRVSVILGWFYRPVRKCEDRVGTPVRPDVPAMDVGKLGGKRQLAESEQAEYEPASRRDSAPPQAAV